MVNLWCDQNWKKNTIVVFLPETFKGSVFP